MSNTPLNPQLYNRRNWLQLSALAMAGSKLPTSFLSLGYKLPLYKYLVANVQGAAFSMAGGKTVPFDWPVAEVPVSGDTVKLSWKNNNLKNSVCRLRITSATDVREACTLEITTSGSQEKIGLFDIRFAHYMQPFEIVIPPVQLQQIIGEGITLKMIKGSKPFWFFIKEGTDNKIPDAYLPHMLVSGGAVSYSAWEDRLLSLSSISTFGWMEGCVLDGLHTMTMKDKRAKKILKQHLDMYFENNTLVYENLINQRSSEKISTVESILPFAMLAYENPQHAMLQTAIEFCVTHTNENGVIADEKGTNRRLKTEECYTISYPLTVLSKMLDRPDLLRMAISTLQARVNLLATDVCIYQNGKELEKPESGNWARGVGWYLLGLVKTVALLPEDKDTKPLRVALQSAAKMVITFQQANGLWSCFIHQQETGVETSGSACIAAALAYGYSKQLLPSECKDAAQRCFTGLKPYFTPDGFLTGTSQVNKGGEGLQRNGFRVISPYTFGFLAILKMSLDD